MSLQSYLGLPVQVVDTDGAAGTSAIVQVEIIATTDLESYDFPHGTAAPAAVPAVVPGVSVTGVSGTVVPGSGFPPFPGSTTQPAEIKIADYQGPNRRVSQRRSGVERRVA